MSPRTMLAALCALAALAGCGGSPDASEDSSTGDAAPFYPDVRQGVDDRPELCADGRALDPSSGCIDTASDPANCGRIGHTCGLTQVCAGGACGCATGKMMCGAGSDFVCADTSSDINFCGNCGHACAWRDHAMPPTCRAGTCQTAVCYPGYTDCTAYCADTQRDAANCGVCGHACGSSQECCGGSCVNTGSDSSNCGSCGHRCGSFSFCTAGACI